MTYETPYIDITRLFTDLHVTEVELGQIASLDIPKGVCVPSLSVIKTDTIGDVLRILHPGRNFDVVGVKAPSEVAEQPLGQATIYGALNRLNNGIQIMEETNSDESSAVAWVSIENGLFRVPSENVSTTKTEDTTNEGVLQFSEDADLSTIFFQMLNTKIGL